MNRVFYFNITYRCNLNCVFCFSNSTSADGKSMKISTIITSLNRFNPDKNDLIVLNGGEPSCHPKFYDLLFELYSKYQSKIAVYSNGSIIDISRINSNILEQLHFIIPIHGNVKMHNSITRVNDSYNHTLKNIKLLNKIGYIFSIKFIINEMMICEKYNIAKFLYEQGLQPQEIIIARLNKTVKTERNNVIIPDKQKEVEYIQEQIKSLHNKYKIKILDYPPCFFMEYSHQIYNTKTPDFYFCDVNNVMGIRTYKKNIMIGNNCLLCNYYRICKIMTNSYLTLALNSDILLLERE